MKTIKRITVICIAVFVLAANLPLCASAVDPVSAATMANALAQAITAYGASQGVSMTFDVASTDGIGEGVHELWNDFKEDIQDNNVPTYDSLAVTMWADIYTKVGNNIGININDTEMPYIDKFWNWLLSGPAAMTKVDNEYYEWTLNQNNTVDPISVMLISDNKLGSLELYNIGVGTSWITTSFDPPKTWTITSVSNNSVYCYYYYESNPDYPKVVFMGDPNTTIVADRGDYQTTLTLNQNVTVQYVQDGSYDNFQTNTYKCAVLSLGQCVGQNVQYKSLRSSVSIPYGFGITNNTTISSSSDELKVQPYIGEAPQDVYIPDNEDVNYTPLPYVGGLDIPWDDSLFGDGSGSLTDAQSEAISSIVDDAITDSLEKTLTLADTENPDIPAPNEVYIPLLPVNLPSFNFSLSGIWHYVVSWVQSLGAWLSLMFQTWAILPSSITIPVYATAVIVIVLGVYKRFFM